MVGLPSPYRHRCRHAVLCRNRENQPLNTEDSTNQYVGRYKIYTSQDNINWTELLEVTNPEPRLTENPPSRKIYAIPADNLNLRTRYLRIESYRGASQQVLGELEIFGRRLPYLEVEKPVIMPWRGEELAITAESLEGAFVTLDIINPKNGSVVKNLVSGGSGETVQAAWDGKDSQETLFQQAATWYADSSR